MAEAEFWAELVQEVKAASYLDPQIGAKAAALINAGWMPQLIELIDVPAGIPQPAMSEDKALTEGAAEEQLAPAADASGRAEVSEEEAEVSEEEAEVSEEEAEVSEEEEEEELSDEQFVALIESDEAQLGDWELVYADGDDVDLEAVDLLEGAEHEVDLG